MKDGPELWRQVSDKLVQSIASGALSPGERLPASSKLAGEFSVHQHTVLKAIAHLQESGLLRVEQGRGTFVVEHPIAFRLGQQTWYEQNLSEQSRIPSRRVLDVHHGVASPEVQKGLGLCDGAFAVCAKLLGEADNVPIYLGWHYLPTDRFPSIAEVFEDLRARGARRIVFSELLSQFGVTDFSRTRARVRSRLPELEEARLLQCGPKTPLLETHITLVDQAREPIVYGVSAYCSDRVELAVDL